MRRSAVLVWTEFAEIIWKPLIWLFFFVVPQPYSDPDRLNVETRPTTVGRTPLDKGQTRRRDLYLTTHDIRKRQPCPPAEFETAIPASERSRIYALDSTADGIGGNFAVIQSA
jgi:hypothetical protein